MSASSMTLTPRIRRSAPPAPATIVAPRMQSRASASRTVIADSSGRARCATSCVMARATVARPANQRGRFLADRAHDHGRAAAYSRAMPTTARTAVVAVGGNTFVDGGGPATIAEQFAAARRLAPPLCRLVADGWRVGLTHGNGPQVGFIMRRSDLVADIEPGLPQLALDMAGALPPHTAPAAPPRPPHVARPLSRARRVSSRGAPLGAVGRASGLDRQVVA